LREADFLEKFSGQQSRRMMTDFKAMGCIGRHCDPLEKPGPTPYGTAPGRRQDQVTDEPYAGKMPRPRGTGRDIFPKARHFNLECVRKTRRCNLE
jgi:hypothetical protein